MFFFLIIFIALGLSFIFSGSEMGLYSLNRLRLRSRTQINWPGSGNLGTLIHQPQKAINTILIGNNMAHYLATASCASLLIGLGLQHRADYYSTMILAPLLVVFTEIMPKMIFLKRADVLMYKIAPWLRLMQILFYPLIRVLDAIILSLNRMSKGNQPFLKYHFTPEKLNLLLAKSKEAGVLSPYQHRMVQNVLRVKNILLRHVMTPLGEVVMVPENIVADEAMNILSRYDYSRLPVYRGTRNNVVGLINLIDVINMESGREDISHIIRPPVRVKLNDSIAHVLYILQKSSQQLAVVVDEGGGAAGICTIKDLVEEIVGDIYDW